MQFTHKVALFKESIKEFAKLSRSLEDQLQTTNARIEVAEELKESLEGQERKNLEDIAQLEKELALAKNQAISVDARLHKKKKKKLSLEKASKTALKKLDEALDQARLRKELS